METQELKKLIVKEAGEYDKWDIEASLKLSENELQQKVQEIRKRKRIGIGVFIFLCLSALFIIFDVKLKILPAGWIIASQIGNVFIGLFFIFISFSRLKKQEYIYQLLLKVDKMK